MRAAMVLVVALAVLLLAPPARAADDGECHDTYTACVDACSEE